MALRDICAYRDQAQHGAGMYGNVRWTGHHIIPDHCFYYTSGMRGMGDVTAFLCPDISHSGYRTENAPVILVTSDLNGGKSLDHGLVHIHFDDDERRFNVANKGEWTYADARAAAVNSVKKTFSIDVTSTLDAYFKGVLGLNDNTVLRAGEQGTMPSAPPPRRSGRN